MRKKLMNNKFFESRSERSHALLNKTDEILIPFIRSKKKKREPSNGEKKFQTKSEW